MGWTEVAQVTGGIAGLVGLAISLVARQDAKRSARASEAAQQDAEARLDARFLVWQLPHVPDTEPAHIFFRIQNIGANPAWQMRLDFRGQDPKHAFVQAGIFASVVLPNQYADFSVRLLAGSDLEIPMPDPNGKLLWLSASSRRSSQDINLHSTSTLPFPQDPVSEPANLSTWDQLMEHHEQMERWKRENPDAAG